MADKRKREHEGAAHNKATLMLHRDQNKYNGASPKKGSEAITTIVNEQFRTTLNVRTVRRCVNKVFSGYSPIKKGPEGNIPNKIFKVLTKALGSYVRINQGNGNGDTIMQKNLAMNVNNVVLPLVGERYSDKLLRRLLRKTDIDLAAIFQQPVEDRRIRWTTYSNLKLWFDSWKRDLVDLIFATIAVDGLGKIDIPDDQLSRILNLDERVL